MKIAAISLLAAAASLLPAWADLAETATLGRTLGSTIGDVVKYEYILKLDDGTIPDSSSEQDAITTRTGNASPTSSPVPSVSPSSAPTFVLAPSGSFSTCDATGPGILSQTESSERDDIGLGCIRENNETGQLTTPQQRWARCYSLGDEGCTSARVITAVTFGVGGVSLNPVDIRINVYKDSGCLDDNPSTGGELVATVKTEVPLDSSKTNITVDICSDIEILSSEAIRVEIEQVEDGEVFFLAGVTENEPVSGASYIRSESCGLPVVEFLDFADIGIPRVGLILDVQTEPAPDGEAYLPANYWVAPLDKPDMTCENVRLKIPEHGEFTCLPIGQGICRDNGGNFGEWRFGIEEVEAPPCELSGSCQANADTNTFPVLIDTANTRYPITGPSFTDSDTGELCKYGDGEAIRGCNYAGTTHICISENIEDDPTRYSNERPFMFFYNEKTHQYLYQLVCDGIGEEGKLPELKMVNNEDLADATYVNYPVDVVKFKKGATPNKEDSNELWKMYMDWDGFEDPDTRRIGKLASFIGVANPKLCKEYVSATDKPCWKENCDDATPPIETPEDYERSDCLI